MPNIPNLKLSKPSDSQMIPFIKSCPKQACLVYNYARKKLGGKLELADSSFKYVLKRLSLQFKIMFGRMNKRAQFFSRGITEMLISNWWKTEQMTSFLYNLTLLSIWELCINNSSNATLVCTNTQAQALKLLPFQLNVSLLLQPEAQCCTSPPTDFTGSHILRSYLDLLGI